MNRLTVAALLVILFSIAGEVPLQAHAQSSIYNLTYDVGSGPGAVTVGNTYYLNFGLVDGTGYYELDFKSSPDLPLSDVGFGFRGAIQFHLDPLLAFPL